MSSSSTSSRSSLASASTSSSDSLFSAADSAASFIVLADGSKAAGAAVGGERLSKTRAVIFAVGMSGLLNLTTAVTAYLPLRLQAGNAEFEEEYERLGQEVKVQGFGMDPGIAYLLTAMENVFLVLLSPLIGHVSERVYVHWMQLGRRRVFVMASLPGAALAHALFGVAGTVAVIIVFILFNALFSAIARPAYQSLLPDLFAVENRAKVNGTTLLFAGLSSGITLGLGGIVFEEYGYAAFTVGISCLILFQSGIPLLLLREDAPEQFAEHKARNNQIVGAQPSILASAAALVRPGNRRTIFILGAAFWGEMASASIKVGLSSFAVFTLGLTTTEAGLSLAVLALFVTFTALFAGQASKRRHRFLLLHAGLLLLTAVALFVYFVVDSLVSFLILLAIGGSLVAVVVVNLLPLAYEEGGAVVPAGVLTGFFYVTVGSGAIVGPIATGALVESFQSHRTVFLVTAASVFIAWLCIAAAHACKSNVPKTDPVGMESSTDAKASARGPFARAKLVAARDGSSLSDEEDGRAGGASAASLSSASSSAAFSSSSSSSSSSS